MKDNALFPLKIVILFWLYAILVTPRKNVAFSGELKGHYTKLMFEMARFFANVPKPLYAIYRNRFEKWVAYMAYEAIAKYYNSITDEYNKLCSVGVVMVGILPK